MNRLMIILALACVAALDVQPAMAQAVVVGTLDNLDFEQGEIGKFGLVDVKAVTDMPKPVTLADAKADPKLKDMVLVKFSRLSVQPVTPAEWKHICAKGGVKS